MDLDIEAHETLEACAAEWDAVVEGHLYLSSEWLIAAGRPAGSVAYALVRRGGEAIAAMVVNRVQQPSFVLHDPVGLVFDREYGAGGEAHQSSEDRARFLQLQSAVAEQVSACYPCAVSIAAVGLTQGFANRGEVDADVARALAEALERVGEDWEVRSHALLYVDPELSDALAGGFEGSYLPIRLDARAVLMSRAPDLESWLEPFKSERRRTILREVESLETERMSIQTLSTAELVPLAERLAVLAANVQDKHGNGFDPSIPRKSLDFLFAQHPNLLRGCLASDADGEPVAFHLLYADEAARTLHSALSGSQYTEAAKAAHAHLNVLYYEPLRVAFSEGFDRLDYGLGALEAHMRRGASLVASFGWVDFPDIPRQTLAEILAIGSRTQETRIQAAQRHRPFV